MKKQSFYSGNYAMYLRKSRADREAEKRGELETLARHEKMLIDTAKRLNLSVGAIYKEVVSGDTIASRPVMQQLLSEVEQGLWSGVLVVEVERLARGDTIDQGIVAQAFKFSHTKIITPIKIYDPNNEFDEEYFEFGLFMSRREYKTINRRLQNGRLASVREGKYAGNKPPYGYQRVKLEHEKGFTLSPVPEQAEVVKHIYQLYVHGLDGEQMGVSKIVRRLNNMKIPAQNRPDWTDSTVLGILQNPVYIGKIWWNHRKQVKRSIDGHIVRERPRAEQYDLYDGLHPAIISEELFERAQAIRKKNPARPIGEHLKIKNPLSGLIVCAECGRKMVRRPYQREGKEPSLICPYTNCKNVSSKLSFVEEKVLESLSDLVRNDILDATVSVDTSDRTCVLDSSLERQKQELEKLHIQQSSLYDLLEQGVYSTDVFLRRSAELKERIDAACSSIESLQAEIEYEKSRIRNRSEYIPKCQHLLEVYPTLDIESKNSMLKELIDHVEYRKSEKSNWNAGKSAPIELHVYPKVP